MNLISVKCTLKEIKVKIFGVREGKNLVAITWNYYKNKAYLIGSIHSYSII